MQMNVSLTPELYEFVQRKVHSGLYGNASEVVRDALRRMDDRVIVDAAWSELNGTLEASVASGRSACSVSDVISRTRRRTKE
ncbi:MAG: type II toxin-antitoxin system ParD family antitoxin [Deltaproteobacteria bacterium]|nr:type II toxin-antitoxin system ParD family antitoxin [Deltaproteobacteria bacterium]